MTESTIAEKFESIKQLVWEIQNNAGYALPLIKRPSAAGVEVELILEKATAALTTLQELEKDMGSEDKDVVLYKHYKGGIYKLWAFSSLEATGERVVTYQCLETKKIWTRTEDEFHEKFNRFRMPQAAIKTILGK